MPGPLTPDCRKIGGLVLRPSPGPKFALLPLPLDGARGRAIGSWASDLIQAEPAMGDFARQPIAQFRPCRFPPNATFCHETSQKCPPNDNLSGDRMSHRVKLARVLK
jgi:hypothetical protein